MTIESSGSVIHWSQRGIASTARAFHALTVALAAEARAAQDPREHLAPGIIRTPLIPDADSLAAIHPLGRVGEVRDTSRAALYLATAGFVTGSTLAVDGGTPWALTAAGRYPLRSEGEGTTPATRGTARR